MKSKWVAGTAEQMTSETNDSIKKTHTRKFGKTRNMRTVKNNEYD